MEEKRKQKAVTGKRRSSPAAREAQRQRRARQAQEQASRSRPRENDEAAVEPERGAHCKRPAAPQQRTEKPTPPPVRKERRDSRAARAAQEHREERKENARLSDLREKQRRMAKQRTHKAIGVEVWKRLIVMGVIVAALALSMIIFFRVRHVDVRGNDFYTDGEICEAASLSDGDNLLTISRGQIAGNVMARLPYIQSVQVTRELPDTIILTVTEFDATYAVQDTAGDWYLMTSSGKITEQVSQQEAKEHILVDNLLLDAPTVGQQATPSAEQGKEAAATRRLNVLLEVLQEIEAAELVREIASVNVASTTSIVVWYGDRFEVMLGSTDQLDYKFEYLKLVVAEQKDYVTGSIDLTLSGGNEVYVSPNEGND